MLSLTIWLTCIFQLPIRDNALTRTNYALNKPVTESYAYPGMESDKAVDGDTTASVKTGDDGCITNNANEFGRIKCIRFSL